MILKRLLLQNFRSYTQADFTFSESITVIIGRNTAGKTNLAEAIQLLSTGKSFKGATDVSLIHFGKEIGRVKGLVGESESVQNVIPSVAEESFSQELRALDPSTSVGMTKGMTSSNSGRTKTTLEVVLMSPQYNNGRFGKKYLVNDVPKSRTHFLGFLPLVLFRPEELDIIIDGPSVRRNFLDDVLEQVDREYAASLLSYERAIRQRNALLQRAKEEGVRQERQFSYWDELVITHGQVITAKREEFLSWINDQTKDVVEFAITYDHSKISRERLEQYKDAEVGAGVTLVGPHRDDFYIELVQEDGVARDVKVFGSRGQQRLVVLQLKLLQIAFMAEKLGTHPLLVLDDIFSELDSGHINLVLEKVAGLQAIITTTHKEFIPQDKLKSYSMIELSK